MENPNTHPVTVLVVDDELDVRFLLNSILKQKAINVVLAGSLAEAESSVRQAKPAVIFLDNHLPDGFGLDHIQKLKREHPAGKIIMITAHDSQKDRQKAYEEGADFFISKPFTKDTIYHTLDHIRGRYGE